MALLSQGIEINRTLVKINLSNNDLNSSSGVLVIRALKVDFSL